ncbi:hypothetical protein Slin15195_G107640 [Septoria linicola]|uniref:Uncharacterized protein n=1 Tax=Septoria linicola TaxID=215465 RepID=A0A9Q9B3C6_9PEZI|nr:hypothetical protein Slin15195_G107640 [Septoria linicola]
MAATTSSTRLMRLIALLLFLSIALVHAQGDLPDLATVTNTNEATSAAETSAASTGDQTTGATTAESTGDATTAESTGATPTGDATSTGDNTDTTSGGTAAPTTATFPDATSTSTGPVTFRLTGLPTIAGAGIPTLVVPYTANAPFMQKSSMPEGTVFIAVGAVLAFLGACVLLWRGLVAWSINRSVKRAALASIRGTEKPGAWGGGHGYNSKAAYYQEYEAGSGMSLDHLTSAGKTQRSGKHDESQRLSSAPPAGLFFSPTAQTNNRASSYSVDNRGSTYLPAGYYASPSADAPAGGRNSTVIGGSNLAPYARNSYLGGASPSPPGTPNATLPGSRQTSHFYGGPNDSRAGPRTASRGPPSRDGYGNRSSHLYTQPSSSSLAVGQSTSDLPGQRAPSAIFDDMLDVHGNGPRERY